MGRNIISADQHLNSCRNLKFPPEQNPNSHLKFIFQFKLRLYLKYNLTFKYEIKLEVLSQFKRNGQQTACHLNWVKTSSLISHLNVKLYFKCEFGFYPGGNFKFRHEFKHWSALIVFLPILTMTNKYSFTFKQHQNFKHCQHV